jgi:transposase
MQCTTIGVDLAKSVFQVSIANQAGKIVDRRRLSRSQFDRFLANQQAAELVMETCATAHFWARKARDYGHQPRLLHAPYVRPYVRRNKTDAADADALIRAGKDPDLKPVPVKSEDQQALQGLHRIRRQWLGTRTQRINLARGLLAEFGFSMAVGTKQITARLRAHSEQIPDVLRQALLPVLSEITALEDKLATLDKQLKQIARDMPQVQRLMSIPGIGVITATAMVASVPDIHTFKRARQFSAWLGITPREYSSGNSRRLGRITRKGDSYLRMLLIHGARAALLGARRRQANGTTLTHLQHWALQLQSRSHHNVAAVALANKMARIIWCVWTSEGEYQPR